MSAGVVKDSSRMWLPFLISIRNFHFHWAKIEKILLLGVASHGVSRARRRTCKAVASQGFGGH